MSRSARKWVFVAGAAALLSTQAAWAAPEPASSFSPVDPLVAVSLFSTPQSQAAVIGSPALAGSAASAAAAQPGPPPPPDHPYGLDTAGLVMMFFVPVAITLAIALEDNGNEPVSPA